MEFGTTEYFMDWLLKDEQVHEELDAVFTAICRGLVHSGWPPDKLSGYMESLVAAYERIRVERDGWTI